MKRLAVLLWLALLVLCASGSYKGGSYGGGSYVALPAVSGVWAGKEFVVVLTADDGYGNVVTGQNSNIGWAAAADSMGTWTYTLDLKQGFLKDGIDVTGGDNGGGAGAMFVAEVQTIVDDGVVDIGSTGRRSTWRGIFEYADLDSLNYDIGPSWIDSLLGVVPSTYCIDGSYINYDAMNAVADSGYTTFRGSVVGGNFDSQYRTLGSPRMDPARYLKWDEPSALFGYASISAEGEAQTPPSVFGSNENDYPDSLTNQAQLEYRLGLLIDDSIANGNYPVVLIVHQVPTREQINWMADYVLERGGLLTSQKQMASIYRAAHTAVDPPGWAVYARLDGVVAADEIFWDLNPVTVSCATSSTAIFSNSTTLVNTANYDFSYTDGMTYSAIRSSATVDDVAIGTGDVMTAAFTDLPLNGANNEDIGLLSFNIDEMDGKEIESATLTYYNFSNTGDVDEADQNFHAIIGVTVDEILGQTGGATGPSDMTYLWKDTSGAVAWTLSWNAIDWVTDLGEFVYPSNTQAASSAVTITVTDYIQHVVENDLISATFAFNGNKDSATRRTWQMSHHEYSSGGGQIWRPYLVVTYCN